MTLDHREMTSIKGNPHTIALNEQQNCLSRALEFGGAFPYEWHHGTGVLIAPDALGELYGLAPARNLTYDALISRIHPEDREAARLADHRAMMAGGSNEQEYRVVLDDGSIRWILVRGKVTQGPDGVPLGLAGVAMEITAQKDTELAVLERERKLTESNRFIHKVLSSSNECIKILDLDANLRFMSEGGMRVMEVDDFSRIEGCSWPAFWEGEAGEGARAAVTAAKAGGSGHFVGFCPTFAGTPKWWDVSVTAILNDEGLPESLLSISRDITERKNAEDALRRSQERLELALTAGKVGTWVWDIPQGIITADERLAAMVEVDPNLAAAGAPVEAYLATVHPADRDRVASIMAEVAERGGKQEVELRLLRGDGSIMWIVARGECQHDAAGRPVRFPAATVDVTATKQVEEARQLLTRELAHRIKNIFSVVNGLISLSARGHPTALPFAQSLRARLTALAKAHEFVRPGNADDHSVEQGSHTVFSLLKALLAPYLEEGSKRIFISGDDTLLGPDSATALALVLHEQATNAMKYGGLSNLSGTVSLQCQLSDGVYSLVWQESGGPTIAVEPERRGFGSELASLSVTGQLGGTISHEWAREGLVMRLSLPLERLGH